VPCLVVEMGIGMRVTPDFTDQVVAGLLALCRAVGVVAPDARLPRCSHVPLIASDEQVRYVNAPTAGLFVPESGHWTTVHEGQLLGRVLSPFDGAIHAELRAPVTGVLFTLREHPLVYEGSLVARLLPTS